MQKLNGRSYKTEATGVALADGGNPVNLTTDVVKTIGSAFALGWRISQRR